MSKRNLGERIKLSSYDDMFRIDDENTMLSDAKGQITELPLSDMHAFANHPFRVVDDEAMAEMTESIKMYGVLVPAIVRERPEGGYESYPVTEGIMLPFLPVKKQCRQS